jgi:D-galactarolactone cycloisomerase
MKITAIEVHLIRVPCSTGAPPRTFVGVSWETMDTLLVRVVTDQGIEGWGEAFGHAGCRTTQSAIVTQVGPAFWGRMRETSAD